MRFFAFANRLQFYAGNLKRFLNEYMASYAPSNPEQIKVQANIFRQTVQNIYNVFGANSARLYSIDAKSNGSWDAKFSVAALDIQAGALVGKPTAKVQAVAEQIREQYLFCLLTDDVLQSAISKQTGGTTQTKYRWNTFKTIVEPIIDETILEPRFFDLTFRRKLFDKSDVCKICGTRFIPLMTVPSITFIPTARAVRRSLKTPNSRTEAATRGKTNSCLTTIRRSAGD